MAVAVKNSTDVRHPLLFDRMPVVSLIGAAYVIACIAVLGKALPYLWWEVIGFDKTSMLASILLLMVLAAAAVGLGYVGLRLLGRRAPVGTRAGIFVAGLGVLLILLLTRWASVWIEYGVYYQHWFGASGVTVGAALTAAVGLVLLGVGIYFFLDRRFERYLVLLEEQGWFSATLYKGQQGLRVRRGTILGILLIVGAGILTLRQRGTLERGPENYEIDIPFTAQVMVTNDTKGDLVALMAAPAGADLAKRYANDFDEATKRLKHPIWMSRYELRDINDELGKFVVVTDKGDSQKSKVGEIMRQKDFKDEEEVVKALGPDVHLPTARPLTPAGGDEVGNYVRVKSAGDATNPDIQPGAIVPVSEFEAEVKKLRGITPGAEGAPPLEQATGKNLPTAVPVALARGTEVYQSLTLLPSVQYTVPLLLIAVALWLAWRVVNFPAFADFQIATEAELNKVSWSSRRKLVQDTIVVLITVFLMAVFLFAMDQTWSFFLSWKQIGVIQLPQKEDDAAKKLENRPW